MASAPPPLPPHPPASYVQPHLDQPPPLPPPPPLSYSKPSPPPHPSTPLPAPRPHRLDPNLPANMARTLDNQAAAFHQPPYHDPYRLSPRPPPQQLPQNFAHSPAHRGSLLPPPNQNAWGTRNQQSPAAIPLPASPRPQQHPYSHQTPSQQTPPLNHRVSVPTILNYSQPPQQPHMHPRSSSVQPSYFPPQAPSPPRQNGVPSLTAPLPTIQSLATALPTIQQSSHDPALKITWARDVLMLVDRAQQNASDDTPPVGPVTIQDPQLLRLVQIALPLVLQIASAQYPNQIPVFAAEAIYLRATFAASGAYPDHIQHNPRLAFRDFEQSARAGYAQAWFRLGRDYENFNDAAHARDCFERGVKLNVESCVYRMGMAHLMGQLGLSVQPEIGLPLIHRAATLASVQVPQPAYVYGLLLLGEFAHVTVPPHLFTPLIPPHSSLQQEARLHLERAAFLHFAPAQYKLGHAYEFASPPFPFEALLSVQYYSLASQQGEVEADMALSKWFLCGAEGAFEKDESLAFTFAEKAARKGLPSAEFAMGYYKEVGVGGPKDIEAARKWYQLASDHDNTDATERLAVLSQPSPQSLSRQEHDNITDVKLVRKRTQAKQRSEREGGGAPRASLDDGRQVVEVIRKNSAARHHAHGSGPTVGVGATPSLPSVSEREQVPMHAASPQGPGTGPGSAQRQFPNQHRYTLVDPGSGSAGGSSPPSRTDSPSYARPAGRPPGQRAGSIPLPSPALPASGPDGDGDANGGQGQTAPLPPRAKAPTTFAEMGIQGVKLEEKDCVIM